MRNRVDPAVPVAAAAGTALLIAFIGFGSLIRQSVEHDRLLAEYQAGRSAAMLTEQLLSSSLPEDSSLPEHVLGFALYGFDGTVITGSGSFPPGLGPDMLPESRPARGGGPVQESLTVSSSRTLILVRSMGGYGGRQGRMFTYLAYDTSSFVRSSRIRLLLFVLAALLFFIAAGSAWLFYRRARRYEKELGENRLMADLGMAARTLAHELKNPLAVLAMQQNILGRSIGNNPAAAESLAIMAEETARISGMIDRVRQFLNSPEEDSETVDLLAAVRERAERLPFPVLVSGPDPEGPVPVRCGRDQLTAAIDNLLVNGHEAQMNAGPPLEVRITMEKERAEASFLDRGPGVPPPDRNAVFHPFFTTKEKGSGVGLAVVKRFAERSGGAVSVGDREGGGAVFRLTLPLAKE